MSNSQPEYILQKNVAQFIRLQYPKVFFVSDAISHLGLNIRQAARNKVIQCANFHAPDLLILEQRHGFGANFLELKAKSIYKKDSFTLLNNPHVLAQMETIEALRERNYRANFFWDFNEIVKEIKWYLDDPK